jgi:hypothetical protein
MSAAAGEACRLAQNLGRNCNFCCFPCGDDKRPTLKDWPNRASADPDVIANLWRDHPGPLIGIVTGERSGFDVLDLDAKHDEARAWFYENRDRLPPTRCFKTRSGGSHLYFRHATGVRNSAGKIAPGVDVRGDGGYVISWWCTGLPCVAPSPIAPWPEWLLTLILPPLAKPSRQYDSPRNTEAAIAGILRAVSDAAEGSRNAALNWAAFHLGQRVVARQIGRGEAETLLAGAAKAAGLTRIEADRTIASGLKGAGA